MARSTSRRERERGARDVTGPIIVAPRRGRPSACVCAAAAASPPTLGPHFHTSSSAFRRPPSRGLLFLLARLLAERPFKKAHARALSRSAEARAGSLRSPGARTASSLLRSRLPRRQPRRRRPRARRALPAPRPFAPSPPHTRTLSPAARGESERGRSTALVLPFAGVDGVDPSLFLPRPHTRARPAARLGTRSYAGDWRKTRELANSRDGGRPSAASDHTYVVARTHTHTCGFYATWCVLFPLYAAAARFPCAARLMALSAAQAAARRWR